MFLLYFTSIFLTKTNSSISTLIHFPLSTSFPSLFINFTNLKILFGFSRNSASVFIALAITFLSLISHFTIGYFVFFHPSFAKLLNASFFLAIAFFTSSFNHHLFPLFFLTFFYPHSSLHTFRTPSLKDYLKFIVSTSTNSSTLLSNFSCISLFFNFQTMRFYS